MELTNKNPLDLVVEVERTEDMEDEITAEIMTTPVLDFVLITIAVSIVLAIVYASIIIGCGASGVCLQ